MHRRAFGLMGASFLAMGAARGASAKTVLKAGHISPKDGPEGVAADRWAQLVKQKTNGAVEIQVYPSEQLGPATAMIESTILGNQDVYIGGNVEFERFSPALKALDLNYAVPGEARFQLDVRSVEAASVAALYDALHRLVADVAARRGVRFELGEAVVSPAAPMDAGVQAAVARAADEVGVAWRPAARPRSRTRRSQPCVCHSSRTP